MRILAIEDNRQFLDLMRSHLAKHGFVVDAAVSLAGAREIAAGREYDIVLLDLGLPDGDGAEFMSELRRKHAPVPIIVLSARSSIGERVKLLDFGADDYLVKPFDLDELVARIRAVARRGSARSDDRLAFADIAFDRQSRQAIVNNRIVTLRAREAALLEALLRRAGVPVHREALLSSLYTLDEEIGSNTLDVHVHHLRRRLAEAGARATIATVRGHGYVLRGRDA